MTVSTSINSTTGTSTSTGSSRPEDKHHTDNHHAEHAESTGTGTETIGTVQNNNTSTTDDLDGIDNCSNRNAGNTINTSSGTSKNTIITNTNTSTVYVKKTSHSTNCKVKLQPLSRIKHRLSSYQYGQIGHLNCIVSQYIQNQPPSQKLQQQPNQNEASNIINVTAIDSSVGTHTYTDDHQNEQYRIQKMEYKKALRIVENYVEHMRSTKTNTGTVTSKTTTTNTITTATTTTSSSTP
jgi:hypothetical protein